MECTDRFFLLDRGYLLEFVEFDRQFGRQSSSTDNVVREVRPRRRVDFDLVVRWDVPSHAAGARWTCIGCRGPWGHTS